MEPRDFRSLRFKQQPDSRQVRAIESTGGLSSLGSLCQESARKMASSGPLLVELPRVSLCSSSSSSSKPSRDQAARIDLQSGEDLSHRAMDPGGQNADCNSNDDKSLASIRLTPPSKRPSFCKLSLAQPLLLFKARRKVELSAFVMDRRNELAQRSGRPIFFPSDYKGKLLSKKNALDKPDRCSINPRFSFSSLITICEPIVFIHSFMLFVRGLCVFCASAERIGETRAN